jgi:hypothetical protein
MTAQIEQWIMTIKAMDEHYLATFETSFRTAKLVQDSFNLNNYAK